MRGYWPPPIWVPSERPTKKWIGRFGGLWIAGLGLAFFLFLLLVDGLLLGNGASITIGLVVGSFTVASAFLYTMAYRIGPRDTLSVARLLIAFGLGGLVAVTLGSTFDSLVSKAAGSTDATPSTVVLLLAGVTEELAKILAVVLVARGLRDKSTRNGLFLGGAVGLGFAAMEDVAYAVRFYEHPQAQLHLGQLGSALLVVPLRALETPFLHPIFTTLLAAALFSSARNGRFRITWRVVLTYLGVTLAHGAFDGSGALLQATGQPLLVLLVLPIFAVIVVVPGLIWIRVARRARWAFQLPAAWWLAPPPTVAPTRFEEWSVLRTWRPPAAFALAVGGAPPFAESSRPLTLPPLSASSDPESARVIVHRDVQGGDVLLRDAPPHEVPVTERYRAPVPAERVDLARPDLGD